MTAPGNSVCGIQAFPHPEDAGQEMCCQHAIMDIKAYSPGLGEGETEGKLGRLHAITEPDMQHLPLHALGRRHTES